MRLSGNRVGEGSSLVELTSIYVQVTVLGTVGIQNEENHDSVCQRVYNKHVHDDEPRTQVTTRGRGE